LHSPEESRGEGSSKQWKVTESPPLSGELVLDALVGLKDEVVKILDTEVIQSLVGKTLSLLYLAGHRSNYVTRTVSLQERTREQLDTHFSLQ